MRGPLIGVMRKDKCQDFRGRRGDVEKGPRAVTVETKGAAGRAKTETVFNTSV